MKKWGLLVTLLYALFILAIVTPASVVLTDIAAFETLRL